MVTKECMHGSRLFVRQEHILFSLEAIRHLIRSICYFIFYGKKLFILLEALLLEKFGRISLISVNIF
jgi:hypothetical protein